MEPIRDPRVLARVQLMFDLYEAAEVMMRQNLRRWFPEESERQIECRPGLAPERPELRQYALQSSRRSHRIESVTPAEAGGLGLRPAGRSGVRELECPPGSTGKEILMRRFPLKWALV
jgi:hypothetical protein